MDYPLVSVIILNYNGLKNFRDILEECIRSVLNTDYPNFEVLFVDNASTDESVDFIKKKFGGDTRLRIIQNERNLGFAEGNNIGIKNARGEYIAILNNDTKVDARWLKELVKVLEDTTIGAAQSKLLQLQNPNLIDCAGGFIDPFGHAHERGRGQEASKYDKIDEIFYAKGAGLIIKRKILKHIGYFDPIAFVYYDETDLCWRVWLNGYKVVYVPTSIVYHAQGSTASKMSEHVLRYFVTRNQLLTLIKNYNTKNLLKNVAAFFLIESRRAIVLLMKRRLLTCFSIFKSLIWNLTHIKTTLSKRFTTQRLIRKVSDDKIQKIMVTPYPPFPHSLIFPRSSWPRKNQEKRS
jgi:GT2 family glycosyltransferase